MLALLLIVGACGRFAGPKTARGGAVNPYSSDDEVKKIVILRPTNDDPLSTANDFVGVYGGSTGFVYSLVFTGFAMGVPPASVSDVTDDPRVEFVADDAVWTAAPVDENAVAATSGQTIPTGIRRVGADRTKLHAQGGDADVTVAVLDTGIDLNHPDLNVVNSVSFVGDETRGQDVYGHGTHVAGIIGARNDQQGVVGVVPGAKLWAVKVLGDKGSGSTSQIIAGLEFVAQHAIEIDAVNMSLGGSGTVDKDCGTTAKDAYHRALCGVIAKGVPVIASAGNAAADALGYLPGGYAEPITVAAISDSDGRPGGLGAATAKGVDDAFATYSNFGEAVDLAAPGTEILSTYKNGGYGKLSGTSMAAPLVTGAAALYVLRHRDGKPPALDRERLKAWPETVRQALVAAATKSGSGGYFTGDRDRFAEPLLDVAAMDPVNPPTPSPSPSPTTPGPTPSPSPSPTPTIPTTPGPTPPTPTTSPSPTTPGPTPTVPPAVTPTPVPATLHVKAATLTPMRDAQGRIYLLAAVDVVDNYGRSVPWAYVTVDAEREGRAFGRGANWTYTTGRARFSITNLFAGCYRVTYVNLQKAGYVWERGLDASPPRYCVTATGTVAADGGVAQTGVVQDGATSQLTPLGS